MLSRFSRSASWPQAFRLGGKSGSRVCIFGMPQSRSNFKILRRSRAVRRAMLEAQRAPDQEFDAVKKEATHGRRTWATGSSIGWMAAYTRLIKLPEEKAN